MSFCRFGANVGSSKSTEHEGKNGMMRAQEEYQLKYTLDDGF
jgi:hypothetical protein